MPSPTPKPTYDEVMVRPTPQTVLDWLNALDFVAPPAGGSLWERTFPQHSLVLTVDVASEVINYGADIQVGRNTVTNFADEENFVVLDAVVALLDAGYAPGSIELEVAFQLGHRAGGYLDVMVRREGRSYLMLECKTFGSEFEKELNKLKTRSASQLMSYVQQDRAAEHAVLYSSRTQSGQVERKYAGFACAALAGQNASELFANWNKEVYETGLLDAAPYEIAERSVLVKDLKDFTNEDGQVLFNLFKEVLRRHAVSDHANAFNKIFNLFICKIIDEDKRQPDQPTEFQWGGSEQAVDVLERLSRLYERGMREYLKLDVTDSGRMVADVVAGLDAAKASEVRRLVGELRQYSNTDFAFIDVYDRASYDQNAEIVRDLVRLLQGRRLRYNQKQGFMGMFFERLLHTSMKQESGQFFTPPPIAQFVNEALPIEHIVERKVQAGDNDFLPYGLDYAAGSGHFLTEFMDRVARVLRGFDSNDLNTKTQVTNFNSWSESLSWAGKFVYGIELDHRLAKTAKVSTFLHGDGDANVVRANGLASFSEDPEYAKVGGKLRGRAGSKDNQGFDVVVANPPYSVSGFSRQLPHGAGSFDLWPRISETSDDIECLFIERTKHVLVDGGVAGVVLPSSILTNPKIEIDARAMLVRYFEIVAMVALNNRVFIATNTPCTIFFLRRRKNADVAHVREAVERFLADGTVTPINGVADAFERYAQAIHEVSATELHQALEAVVGTSVDTINEMEWVAKSNYPKRLTRNEDGTATHGFTDYLRRNEGARMEAFLATLNQRTIVAVSPEGPAEQNAFLGYSFSERRRREGIVLQSGTDTISTPLFDPEDSSNPDKISTLIKEQYLGNELPIPSVLEPWVKRHSTQELVGLAEPEFEWTLHTRPVTAAPNFITETSRLSALCNIQMGSTPTRTRPDYFRGDRIWLKIKDMVGGGPAISPVLVDSKEKLTEEATEKMKAVPEGALLMSFKLNIGRTAFAGTDLYTNEAIAAFTMKPAPSGATAWADLEYLDVLLRRVGPMILGVGNIGQKKFGRTLSGTRLKALHIPVGDAIFITEIKAIDADDTLTDEEKSEAIAAKLW